jgi:hypothetical protein
MVRLPPLWAVAIVTTFPPLTFAQRFRCAAAIRALPAAERVRLRTKRFETVPLLPTPSRAAIAWLSRSRSWRSSDKMELRLFGMPEIIC